MPTDRDDPPAEAVAGAAHAACKLAFGGTAGCSQPCASCQRDFAFRFRMARTLPAAARWRLIGWLAQGLEPTRGMRTAYLKTQCVDPDTDLRAMLTAAREASDAD